MSIWLRTMVGPMSDNLCWMELGLFKVWLQVRLSGHRTTEGGAAQSSLMPPNWRPAGRLLDAGGNPLRLILIPDMPG